MVPSKRSLELSLSLQKFTKFGFNIGTFGARRVKLNRPKLYMRGAAAPSSYPLLPE